MSVSPSDFLQCAETLAVSGDKNEMMQRNILSRAYYAAYHRACEFVPFKNSDKSRDSGMHRSYFEQLLQNKNGTIERKIGEKLKSMYSRRILADYRLKEDIRPDQIAVQLHSARALFKLLENPTQFEVNAVVMPLQRK